MDLESSRCMRTDGIKLELDSDWLYFYNKIKDIKFGKVVMSYATILKL